ncbi:MULTISPECIES: LPXTG cell wall anchor domain-containing protein [unclassified Arthrobacter]|uniref:LPXTG cell wall anchor domain-containing protein n=1 Tax=unclassified Arthrobacter TaxID=235627 RepID=UPI002103DF4D|nr:MULTISPECIES: LPXTG cell wall anchor domain-containing protein [unclassified Arthrobacter]MCQ1986162.1 LPXTG cell wall anchor domain-containing protein [Arthrobacter sp. zg-Y844]MCQ1994098.1 LPXTG cell wall anchor domain-containing protein [Arthrobacter sp. zg-Y1171]UWX81797.1 LPXTG cell wall anchor domain-containing protein [Arthrobacter sp. zg-Y1171]
MQENSRNISARVGAVSAVALLAVSGAFIASPAMAGELDPSAPASPPATTPPTTPPPTEEPTTPPTTPPATQEPTAPATPPATQEPTAPATEAPTAPAVLAPPTTNLADGDVIKTSHLIKGTAPGATSVELSINGAKPDTIAVAADGTWSILAPTFTAEGGATLTLTIVAINGDTRSEPTTVVVTLEDAPLPAPGVTTPTRVVDSLKVLTGNGVPGATVTITIAGDVAAPITGVVTVGENGIWELALETPLGYGGYDLTLVQSQEGKESSETITDFIDVVPAAPVVTTPGEGAEVPVNKLPAAITGTAVPGADVELVVDFDLDGEADVDELAIQATVADASGNWSVPLTPLAEGAHNIVAIQAVGDAISDFSDTSFTVTAAVVAPPVTVNPVPAGNPGAGGLPDTGAANLGLLAGGGAALLTAGGAALLFNRRRNAASES